jgi:hypothetical protein
VLAVVGCALVVWEGWKGGRVEGWKAGRVEGWKVGGIAPRIPADQSSNLPIFQSSNLPPFHPSIPALLAGLWLIFTILMYLYYNLSLVQFQGRYLFPALVPIGLLATLGLREILSRRWVWVGMSLCGATAVAVGISSALGGGLDKWGLLVAGGATLVLGMRRWLPARFDGWVLATPMAGLAVLSVYSLFAFIVPFL